MSAPLSRTRNLHARYTTSRKTLMFENVSSLVDEFSALEQQMADPALHNDHNKAKRVGRRYAELGPVVRAYREWLATGEDLETAREFAEEDSSMAEEAKALEAKREELTATLEDLLAPRDPNDARDVILEVKAGAGGDESALFAADLVRMYEAYATRNGWSTEIITETENDLGGYKDLSMSIRTRGNVGPAEGVWAHLKYEGGVHRVQRVPVTESQGRIHTSAVGVLVVPEADEADEDEFLAEQLHPNNLRIDVYRSSGPGGQSVNTTDSAVRITHLPTGLVVSCQNEKSQLQNKEQAMRILRSRLLDAVHAEQEAEASATRRSQVRTVDRSERIRTYNFPENRIADHRTGYKANNLDQVLNGDLEPVVKSLMDADREAMLAAAGSNE
ncbi:peptide chain release factor 1 [Dermabacter vaginalis]|uniref:Peptide chain release factor 1 n=2 Tax=Dermabacter vaginalis TaxID=1630135 RepID=A0A1B0ZIT8_9MICO|nr:peptide chain release factor 1 [Dermabacter vaginalis]